MKPTWIALILMGGLWLVLLIAWPTGGGCLTLDPNGCPATPMDPAQSIALVADVAAFVALALYLVVATLARFIRSTH